MKPARLGERSSAPERDFDSHKEAERQQAKVGNSAIHVALCSPEAKLRTLIVPEQNPCRYRYDSEEPQLPTDGAVANHFPTVAAAIE
jgi:hypothetical protein